MKKISIIAALAFAGLLFISILSGDVLADGTETLGPPVGIGVASGTGIVAAGTGLISQSGTIVINVPGAVSQALLYWEGQMSTDVVGDNTITVNGTPVTGSLIGGQIFFFSGAYSSAFRADITDLVSAGSNTLNIAGVEFTKVANGAGVLVIYDDGSDGADIAIRDGVDLAFINFPEPRQSTVPQTFTFDAASYPRMAQLSMFFSSVSGSVSGADANRPTSIEVTVDGTVTTFSNELASFNGEEWDTVNKSVVVPAGATSLMVRALSRDDLDTGNLPASFAWIAAGLSIVPFHEETAPGITVTPTFGLTTTEAGDTATFTVVLDTQPTADVTIALSSSDTTEGTVTPADLTFTPADWSTPQTVTVIGVNDAETDGSVTYTIQIDPAVSDDPDYNGFDPADVSVTNAEEKYTLFVTTEGIGTGTVTSFPAGIDCGAACSADFGEGTSVTLTGTPDAGSALDGWSGADCQGNGNCMVTMDQDTTVTATFNPDTDADGISDLVEDSGPYNGDGNRDRILDSQQPNVATFRNINGNYVTFISEAGTELADMTATVNPSSGDAPEGKDFPQGFFGFKVKGLIPGAKTTVTVLLHMMDTGLSTYYKYGPTSNDTNDHWYKFRYNGTTGAEIIQDFANSWTEIRLVFTDGLRGDDDLLANGEIIDIGAPATKSGNGDSGGGCFITTAVHRSSMAE